MVGGFGPAGQIRAIRGEDGYVERTRILLEGDIPSPINPAPGCRFYGRCPVRQDICSATAPELTGDGRGGFVACHFAG